jgi:putative transposase
LIFSTKNREHFLSDKVRPSLHAFMATVLKNVGCHPIIVNSTEDHIHLLFDLARPVGLSQAVQDVKTSSSKWIKTQGPEFRTFAWQAGYGGFAVSQSLTGRVRAYISKQEEHHRKISFQDEYRAILRKHGVSFDERYIWD